MEFPKSVTIDACESFLADLKENNEPLVIPVGTASYAFGGLSSAVQAVNTWVRKNENRVLNLRASATKDVADELIKHPHKFSVAMSAKSIKRSGSKTDELRPQVNEAAKLAIEKQSLHKYGQQRGPLCWFAFVDHSSKGFDRNFYIEKSGAKAEPRQAAQFQAIIRAMVDKSMAVAGGAKPLERESVDYIGRIFYELFLNTHEHGTRSVARSEWIKPGVRIISTQAINLAEEAAQGITKKQAVLHDYLQSLSKRPSMKKKSRFAEVSIVDSGLGYCERWMADHQIDGINSLAAEYKIFKKCFTFRQTSTSVDGRGHGLPVVMDRLTKLDGFMRIRSGRLSLFRDFIASPYDGSDDCTFSDWSTNKPADKSLTPMSPVSGVAISILIPLEEK